MSYDPQLVMLCIGVMSEFHFNEVPIQTTKREIAQVQLVEAINLFLEEKFIPSITLAGAAEEVFAGLVKQAGFFSIAEISIEEITKIRETTGLNVLGGRPKNEIFNLWNSARNALKHHNKSEPEDVLLHPMTDAYMMVRRALFNAEAIDVVIGNRQDFENWRAANLKK